MSEVVTGAVAAAAVGTCVAMIGAAVGIGYVAYRSVRWLSDRAKKEMERLEQELEAQPAYATTAQAREAFEKQFARVRAMAAQSPALKDHADAVARILAVQQSPLGAFLDKAQWQTLCAEPVMNKQTFAQLLSQAGQQFTAANAAYVSRSIVEVAKEAGFVRPRHHKNTNGKETLVLEDDQGRALVADVCASDEGAKINLDLTGFGNGSCHAVMDRILKGLAERDIRLDQAHRRSHYRREGVTTSAQEYTKTGAQAVRPVSPEEERGEAETRRRQHFHGTHQVKTK